MIQFRKIAAAAALLLAAGTAHAQDGQKIGEWELFTNDNNCALIRQMDGGNVLWFAYSRSDDGGRVMVLDQRFGSIDDLQSITADLFVLRDGRSLERAPTTQALGAELENGLKGIYLQGPGNALLTSLAKADGLTLTSGSATGSYATGPMAPAIAELRNCGEKF